MKYKLSFKVNSLLVNTEIAGLHQSLLVLFPLVALVALVHGQPRQDIFCITYLELQRNPGKILRIEYPYL